MNQETDVFRTNPITALDVHSHIIPAVDDGARDFVESIELIALAYQQGIRTLYATPHYSRHRNNAEIRFLYEELLFKLQEQHPEIASKMSIILGHELVYHTDLVERLRSGQAFPLGDSRFILIEFMPSTPYRDMYRQLQELLRAGYKPVIAHMERYEALYDIENVSELKHLGCLMQMNYDSIVGDGVLGRKALFGGRFDRSVRRCRELILGGYIDVYGTDMHRRDFRPPDITDAVKWLKDKGIEIDET